MRTYLDHNATSPMRPEAKAAMRAAMELCGNASSVHAEGRAARQMLDNSREQVARAVGVIAPMVVFASGGSEANNLALKGAPVSASSFRPSSTRRCWKRRRPAARR